jgi:hypothetical protein
MTSDERESRMLSESAGQRGDQVTLADGGQQPETLAEARTGLLGETPWVTAVLVGLAAFAVGLLVTFGLGLVEDSLNDEYDIDELGDEADSPGVARLAGWLFYNAQFVDIDTDGETALETGSVDLLAEADERGGLVVPVPVWRLIPVVVLVVAGAAFAAWTLPEGATGTRGAKRGATVVTGYALAAALGAVLFAGTLEGARAAPALPDAVLLAGLAYPLTLGALGGYLAARLRHM